MALKLLDTSGNHLLPPHHPTVRHVHAVVSRILDANDLGVVKVAQPSRGLDVARATGGAGIEDAGEGKAEGGRKRWILWVVDHPNTVNALVTFGEYGAS